MIEAVRFGKMKTNDGKSLLDYVSAQMHELTAKKKPKLAHDKSSTDKPKKKLSIGKREVSNITSPPKQLFPVNSAVDEVVKKLQFKESQPYRSKTETTQQEVEVSIEGKSLVDAKLEEVARLEPAIASLKHKMKIEKTSHLDETKILQNILADYQGKARELSIKIEDYGTLNRKTFEKVQDAESKLDILDLQYDAMAENNAIKESSIGTLTTDLVTSLATDRELTLKTLYDSEVKQYLHLEKLLRELTYERRVIQKNMNRTLQGINSVGRDDP